MKPGIEQNQVTFEVKMYVLYPGIIIRTFLMSYTKHPCEKKMCEKNF